LITRRTEINTCLPRPFDHPIARERTCHQTDNA
jgi:hypothetical protein